MPRGTSARARPPPPRGPRTPPPLCAAPTASIRSLTGSELFAPPAPPSPPSPPSLPSPPSSPTSPPDKRYALHGIALFRSASGAEQPLPAAEEPLPLHMPYGARTSSVTADSKGSPEASLVAPTPRPYESPLSLRAVPLADRRVDEDDDSTYSHASAVNLDDLSDSQLYAPAPAPPPRRGDLNRQSVLRSFARAARVKSAQRAAAAHAAASAAAAAVAQLRDAPFQPPSPPPPPSSQPLSQPEPLLQPQAASPSAARALVLARPELQRHNSSTSLTERCVGAFTEALDMNRNNARIASERFQAFAALYTRDERALIADMLRESSKRLRNETSTPWRSPLSSTARRAPSNRESSRAPEPPAPPSALAPWARRTPRALSDDALVRSVVYGAHVIPGVQSAEAILLRMAGEYQREEVNRRATRAERLDVPLSFAMTLTAALAAFARLDCTATYKRYRSRSAAHRRSNPQAFIVLKTRYDGLKLSFAVTLHGESPCTVLFRRPRTLVARKLDDYATIVTEVKDVLADFGREVSGTRE